MSGEVALVVDGENAAELAAWLEAEDALIGCVRRDPGPVPEGALGAGLEQLVMSVGSGGVATAMASVLIAWLRRRSGPVTVRVTRPDGITIEVQAEQVQKMKPEELRAQVNELAAAIWRNGDVQDPTADGAPHSDDED